MKLIQRLTKTHLLIIIVIGLFLPQTWFKEDYLINNGDFAFPMRDLLEAGTEYFYTWVSGIGTGVLSARAIPVLTFQAFLALAKFSGLPLVMTERILFSLLFVSTGLSMYLFTDSLLRDKTKSVWVLFSALLYMFNPYALAIIWYSVHGTVLFYALCPFVLAFYLRGLRSVNFPFLNLILFNLFTLLSSFAFAGPPIIFVVWFSIFLILIYFLIFEREQGILPYLRLTFVYFLSWILVNAWWFLPIFFTLREAVVEASVYFASGSREVADILQSSLQILADVSSKASFLNLFRLFSQPRFLSDTVELGDKAFSYGRVYLTPTFLILSFVPTIFIFSSFLIVKGKDRKPIYYFGLVWLLLLFLVKGYHTPLGREFYSFIFENLFFTQGFRDPQEKFGTVWLIVSAFLFGGGIFGFYCWLKEKGGLKFSRLVLPFLGMLIFGVFMFPFWTGQVAFGGGKTLFSQHVALLPHYKEAYDWFSGKEESFKIFPLPDTAGRVVFKLDGINGGIAGGDLSYRWLSRPILSNDKSNLFLTLVSEIISGITWGRAQFSLGLLNAKYVLYHRDIIREFFPDFEDDQVFKDSLEAQGLKSEYSSGKLDFYKIDDDYFLPHFFIPRAIIYSEGGVAGLVNANSFSGYDLRSGIYLTDLESEAEKSENKEALLDRADDVFAMGERRELLFSVEEFEQSVEEVMVPNASINPLSWKYYLVQVKEYFERRKAGTSLDRVDILLWLAVKRVSEIENYDLPEDVERTLVARYLESVGESISILKNIPDGDRDDNYWVKTLKVLRYMRRVNASLSSYGYGFKDSENPVIVYEDFMRWVEKAASLWCDKYCFSIKAPESGEYEIFIDKVEIGKLKNLTEVLDSLKVEIRSERGDVGKLSIEGVVSADDLDKSGSWYNLGEISLDGEEEYIANVSVMESGNLLDSGDWVEADVLDFGDDLNLLFQSRFFGEADRGAEERAKLWEALRDMMNSPRPLWTGSMRSKSINNWDPLGSYKVSFDYFVSQGEFGLSIIEDVVDFVSIQETDFESPLSGEKTQPRVKKVVFDERFKVVGRPSDIQLERDKRDPSCKFREGKGCYRHFEKVVQADRDAKSASLYVYTYPDFNKFSEIDIESLKVQRLLNPRFVLRKVREAKGAEEIGKIPKIAFARVNPTKYKVKVEGAGEPYTLVFSESFHPGWKVYLKDQKSEIRSQRGGSGFLGTGSFGDWVTKGFGEIGEGTTSIFLRNSSYGDIVATYFDGEIKEGRHRDIFLEPATFETWGEKPISEERHLLINGYANSWHIIPGDVGGTEDYELIVEFGPQRLVYVGFFITLTTFAGCVVYFGYKQIRRMKR